MSQLKFFLSDTESLEYYKNGVFANLEDVKRRLFLKSREQSRKVPDSHYLLEREITFDGIVSICDIFSKGLKALCKNYLEIEGHRVYVRMERQTEWQELITFIPPLFLQCVFLSDKIEINKNDISSLMKIYKDYILPNSCYTAIPNARIPQLDYYVKQQEGLHDLHMHLNGALETDQVWQDFLRAPEAIYKDLKKAFRDPKVKEQLEQESHLLDANPFISLLKTARRLRSFFYDFLFHDSISGVKNKKIRSKAALLNDLVKESSIYSGSYEHPFLRLVSSDSNYSYLMSVEALMYLLVINEINETNNEVLAGLFHFYLLILGLANRLLVQQTHQNGFDQFQKHTLNGLREQSEKKYLRRYFQMQGNNSTHLQFLEGRFSPKDKEGKLITFIDDIWKGWENMCNHLKEKLEKEDVNHVFNPKLRLIAHFIKRPDKNRDPLIRHKALRYDIWNRGRVLSNLLKRHPRYHDKIVAVDAAANEFDAQPEVFAPVFRLMRRSGIKHFTFHAGEDFYHIPGGLRAIYEAIVFCDLRKGDRIGHATAAGLSATQWAEIVNPLIYLRQGEYLDDLIFVYHLIIKCKLESLHSLIPFIANRIQDLNFTIYNEHFPLVVLEKAWMMRQCCPVHLLNWDKEDVNLKTVFSDDEWCYPIANDFVSRTDREISKDDSITRNRALDVFMRYHDNSYGSSYNKIISVDPFEILKMEDIEVLQLALLREMNKREIVIETLPTSNVRIGFHQDYKTYHLKNWVDWRQRGLSIPPIVVGSDDTGIFATNIYNEYANIYCCLLYHHNMSHLQIMDVIKRLNEDSHIYRFN